jgi:hypothetical protein
MAGTTFGGKATSFDYRTIVGVEVRSGFSQGEFEIIAAALSAPQGTAPGISGRSKKAPMEWFSAHECRKVPGRGQPR